MRLEASGSSIEPVIESASSALGQSDETDSSGRCSHPASDRLRPEYVLRPGFVICHFFSRALSCVSLDNPVSYSPGHCKKGEAAFATVPGTEISGLDHLNNMFKRPFFVLV